MKQEKILIYQVLVRLFGNEPDNPVVNGTRDENGSGKFHYLSKTALTEIRNMGFTHVWLTGVIEHAIVQGYPEHGIPDGNPLVIKGKAGSPYAISDYYDVNPDLAVEVDKRMKEFEALVDRCHQSGLKVIMDFVPNHVAREYHSDMKPNGMRDLGVDDDHSVSFSAQNNFYYLPGQPLSLPRELKNSYPDCDYNEFPAKATGNDCFSPSPGMHDWYETVKLNYGVDVQNNHEKHFDPIPDTWKKMRHILHYWAGKNIDGFRCDMAEMVPVEFWQYAIRHLKSAYPDLIFIAEIYNPDLYHRFISHGQFDYLYDKVGLYDTLREVINENQPAGNITACWQNLHGLDDHMLRFLENHDEQRLASPFFAGNAQKAIPAMVVAMALNNGPAMVYFGQEVGEPAFGRSGFSGDDGRTTIFDYWHMPVFRKWTNRGAFDGGGLSAEQLTLRKKYIEILSLGKEEAVSQGHFFDLMYANQNYEHFNTTYCYAWIRYTAEQKLLGVVNFSPKTMAQQVKIPGHALEMMALPSDTRLQFSDFFNGGNLQIHTSRFLQEQGVKVSVEGYGFSILTILRADT